MELLLIAGVDISHGRLVDLANLADQARPFYEWVEKQFQQHLSSLNDLEQILLTVTLDNLKHILRACYKPASNTDLPLLFDGIGRTYPHPKACYYFFSWLIRDAPQQRLSPLISRILKQSSQRRIDVEIDVIANLIVEYRSTVKTFSWDVVREVIIDRLEGSRRSIKGHEKETVVRTALLVAIRTYYELHAGYGIFAGIEIPSSQVIVGNDSYDVSANFLDRNGDVVARLLMPIKTRETEGGGHSHLFSRDISSAINAIKSGNLQDYLAVVIVAKNWSQREADNLTNLVDHLAFIDLAPSEFLVFEEVAQLQLNKFLANIFDGNQLPKIAERK